MKIRFNRMLSIICAVMLLICAVSVWADAENMPSTPTDLTPVDEETVPEEPAEEPETPAEETKDPEEEPGQEPKKESEEESEGPVDSVEIVITKTLTINQSWEGKMSKTRPAVLKLDLAKAGRVNMVIDGKDVWATVQKADRLTENLPRIQTDSETGMLTYGWEAEAGSYLITLGPVEPNLLARATVSFMDNQNFQTWQAEQEKANPEPEPEPEKKPATEAESEKEPEPETEPDKEPEPESEPVTEPAGAENKPEEEPSNEPENKPEEEQPEENGSESETALVDDETLQLPEYRNVAISVTWDDEYPTYGSVAHFHATLIGYNDLDYSLQWQWSADNIVWNDVVGATYDTYDVVYTRENGGIHWRVMLYVYIPEEE